jgi:hypothetical protein
MKIRKADGSNIFAFKLSPSLLPKSIIYKDYFPEYNSSS